MRHLFKNTARCSETDGSVAAAGLTGSDDQFCEIFKGIAFPVFCVFRKIEKTAGYFSEAEIFPDAGSAAFIVL